MLNNQALVPAAIDRLCVRKSVRKLTDPETPGLSIELLESGKPRWLYRRRIAGTAITVILRGGTFPAVTIADACAWAAGLNASVEAGIDPRVVAREEERATREAERKAELTVAVAHELYMQAVREGRASRAKRRNKARTIKDKIEIYARDIAPRLGDKVIYEVTEAELVRLVQDKGRAAKIRANRLAAELKVFFGWCASLRGLEVGLEVDPSRRLGDLRYPETPRERALGLLEIEWFLRALVEEPRDYRRGQLLWLLTAARRNELALARREELVGGIWTIPAGRSKNSVAHSIALGPWGLALMAGNGEWIFPAERADGPRRHGWYKSIRRVHGRMEALAGRPIDRFSPHDFRRTARSNTKRLKVDFETAEAMLNHIKTGLERNYEYDAAGNRTKLTWNDGFSITYKYDYTNQMTGQIQSETISLANCFLVNRQGRQETAAGREAIRPCMEDDDMGVREYLPLAAAAIFALWAGGCSPSESPFLITQLCLKDDQGVVRFGNVMREIAISEHMSFVDGGSKTRSDLEDIGQKSFGINTVNLAVEGYDGVGVTASNLGLSPHQVSLGFTHGTDRVGGKHLAEVVIRRLGREWHVTKLPSDRGALPLKDCG